MTSRDILASANIRDMETAPLPVTRADENGRWDLVAQKVRERLDELRWDGSKARLRQLLNVNEHAARRLYEGVPYDHSDKMRRAASLALGWAPDGIDRLARGDESGAEVVHSDRRSSRHPTGLEGALSRAPEHVLEEVRALLEPYVDDDS